MLNDSEGKDKPVIDERGDEVKCVLLWLEDVDSANEEWVSRREGGGGHKPIHPDYAHSSGHYKIAQLLNLSVAPSLHPSHLLEPGAVDNLLDNLRTPIAHDLGHGQRDVLVLAELERMPHPQAEEERLVDPSRLPLRVGRELLERPERKRGAVVRGEHVAVFLGSANPLIPLTLQPELTPRRV